MHVPYSYLGRQFAEPQKIFQEMERLVRSGDFTLGQDVSEFEERFAKLIGTKYAVGVGSGTDALFLSLKALGIDKGAEVITATNTFVATAGAIETAGARIVFVDCDDRYVMDLDKVEAAITPRTKAIMPVHFSGQPVDIERLKEIIGKRDIHIVEDACCAIDAGIGDKRCGTQGIMAGFSLHPLKNLNIWGDGGVITTDSEDMAKKLKLLRNHGMVDRDTYAFYAYNSRLDSLQAIVGNYLIDEVKEISDRRIANAQFFDESFSKLEKYITLPPRDKRERNVYHMYMFLADRRDQLNEYLQSSGIESKIHYPTPLHLQPASKGLGYGHGDFPVAESQARRIISLPVHQHLSREELVYTAKKVCDFYES